MVQNASPVKLTEKSAVLKPLAPEQLHLTSWVRFLRFTFKTQAIKVSRN